MHLSFADVMFPPPQFMPTGGSMVGNGGPPQQQPNQQMMFGNGVLPNQSQMPLMPAQQQPLMTNVPAMGSNTFQPIQAAPPMQSK